MIVFTTLMEDKPSENLNLEVEHGLSFWIQIGETKFLFDCGSSGRLIKNAKKLDIDLKTANFTVCSHSHYDHAGGYRSIVEHGGGGKRLYTGKGFFEKKYAFDGVKYTDLSAGFSKEFLTQNDIEHKVCDGVTNIGNGCYLVSGFERNNSFETIHERFVKLKDDTMIKDDFEDEVCVVIETSKGLVVLVGCSHPGILNMIEMVYAIFNKPVYAIFGGTHLVEADSTRINKTIQCFKSMGLKIIGLNHCSGEVAERLIHEDRDVKSCHLAVGDCIMIS